MEIFHPSGSLTVFYRSVRIPFLCYQTREHDILIMNEPILMQIGTSSSLGKSVNLSTLEVRRLKLKATGWRIRSRKSLRPSTRYLKNYLTNFNQTWQAHITVNTLMSQEPGHKRSKVKVIRG